MTNLKNKSLTKLFYVLFGFFIISYIIYVRLILVRIPKYLIMTNPLNYSLIIIMLTWIFICIFIIIKSIMSIFKFHSSTSKIQKILLNYYNIFYDSLTEVYQIIINNIENSYDIISYLAKTFYKYFGQITEGLFLYISYFIRFIIVSSFLFDVFYLFQLKYFYKTLFLLIIPICINVFIYIFKDIANNLEDAESFLSITVVGTDPTTNEPIIDYRPRSGNEDIDLTYHIEQFVLCSKLNGYFYVYDFLASYYNPRINIIIYFFYLIGWFHVLLINLNVLLS